MVDDLRLVLRARPGQELALRLGDAQLVEGVLDVSGHVVPVRAALICGTHEVVDVVEVDAGQVRAPVGHRALLEVLQRLEAELPHPLRLALHPRDFFHHVPVQPLAGLVDVVVWRVKAVLLGVTIL